MKQRLALLLRRRQSTTALTWSTFVTLQQWACNAKHAPGMERNWSCS